MVSPPHLSVPLLLLAVLCLVVSAATNYSVDDQDPLFRYSGPGWERNTQNLNISTGANLDKDGGHMLATSPSSSATITYTFASVYFEACLWPYAVSTNYAIDGGTPIFIDMQDHSPTIDTGGNASVASNVIGQWISSVNQEHTIHITVPAGAPFAVVDMFIFEVLDTSDTSSTVSSTSQTSSSSTGTTSGAASSSSSSSPSSSLSSSSSGTQRGTLETQAPPSGSQVSQGASSNVERALAISMGILGFFLALLVVFLLWRFCRKRRNGEIVDYQITPQYHPIPTIPGIGTRVPLYDNSIPMMSNLNDATNQPGIQNENLYGGPITLSYDRGFASYSGLPTSPYTDQPESPHTQQVHHVPQRRVSTLSTMTDGLPMYRQNPNFDEFAPVPSSSNANTNTNEKRGRTRANRAVATNPRG